MNKKLTPKQRKLRQTIGYVTYIGKVDPDCLPDDPEFPTTHLEHVLTKLVVAEVHSQYALIDEYLTLIIGHFFFRRPKAHFRNNNLWRTSLPTIRTLRPFSFTD